MFIFVLFFSGGSGALTNFEAVTDLFSAFKKRCFLICQWKHFFSYYYSNAYTLFFFNFKIHSFICFAVSICMLLFRQQETRCIL